MSLGKKLVSTILILSTILVYVPIIYAENININETVLNVINKANEDLQKYYNISPIL